MCVSVKANKGRKNDQIEAGGQRERDRAECVVNVIPIICEGRSGGT